MRIGFYNPYFDSLSGGERYTLALAAFWSIYHDVTIFWDDADICKKAEARFSLDLSRVRVVPNIFLHGSLLQKITTTKSYDCMFFLSDGSIPISCAKKNILHFQVPFAHISFPWWKQYMYNTIVVNSFFTKMHIDQAVGKKSTVIYPPVSVQLFSPGKKKKEILSVGRFSPKFQAKKQEVILDIVRAGYERGLFSGWTFRLSGGLLPQDAPYLDMLKQKAAGLPVTFHPNCSFQKLQEQYAHATMYIHAAGFGETDPTKMEHFGITTVEAMASGCIPLVYKAGGQTEIVTDGVDGYLWETGDECLLKFVSFTKEPNKKDMVQHAVTKAQQFSEDAFCKAFDTILGRI